MLDSGDWCATCKYGHLALWISSYTQLIELIGGMGGIDPGGGVASSNALIDLGVHEVVFKAMIAATSHALRWLLSDVAHTVVRQYSESRRPASNTKHPNSNAESRGCRACSASLAKQLWPLEVVLHTRCPAQHLLSVLATYIDG